MAPTDPSPLGANEKPLRRGPIVYLDQSTLCEAFEAVRGEGDDLEANAGLAALIKDVARRGTLFVSSTHLIELAKWHPYDRALGLARWLDDLAPLWFQMQGAADVELEEEVGRRLRLEGICLRPDASSVLFRTVMSRMELETRTRDSVSSGLRLISTGHSLPSLRSPWSSSLEPIARVRDSAKYPTRLYGP